LDLSGLRRRDQIRAVLRHCEDCDTPCPTVLMGDFNQWGRANGVLREFSDGWTAPAIGNSFPSRRPLAPLDRIVHSDEWNCHAAGPRRAPGHAFPGRRPLAPLDRIVHSDEWNCHAAAVHHSALAAAASDHLPVKVTLELAA